MKRVIWFFVLVSLIIVGGVWSSLGSGPRESATSETTMAELPISYSAVTYLANTLGYYEEENVGVNVTPVPAGPDVIASLRSPSGADLGTIAVTPVVSLIAAGAEPIILATTLTSNEQVQLVTFEKTGITKDPASLKGKRIGRVRNTVGEIYLSRLLEKGGLSDPDVTLVDGRPADLVNLLVTGELDAAALWDPFVPQSKRSYEAQRASGSVSDRGEALILVDTELYTLAYNIVTTKGKLKQERDAIRNVIRAVIKAEDYIRKNPSEAQAKLEAWLDLEEGDLDHFMQTTDFRVGLNVPEMERWLTEELVWLSTVQDVSQAPASVSQYIDASFLKEIDAGRVMQ